MPKTIGPFWALFNSLPVGAVLFDLDDEGFVEFNDAACAQLGYSREAFSRLKVGDIDALRSGAEIQAERRKLVPGAHPQRFSTRQRAADGQLRHVDVTLQCIDLNGRSLGYAVWHDVTDRESAIASLRAREAELARVQRIGRVGGYEVDLQAGFSSLRSPEYLELHNLPPEAVNEPHEAWVRRLHPDDRERVDQFFRDTVASDALAYESEYRIVTPDGQTRWISSVAEIERDEAGRALRMVGAHMDVTALRQAEQALASHAARLEVADRRKNEFLAMLGHELRNPLAPILSVIERLRLQDASLPPELVHAHAVVQRQVTHLRVLVDELLDVARITTGKIVLTEATVNLVTVIRAAVEQTQDLVAARRHRLELGWPMSDDDPTPILVRGDVARLTQVVANLLDNAAKYTEPGGLIRVRLDAVDGDAVIVVSDNGLGIPADTLPDVFDLYVQSGGHRGSTGGGLGVGLTLAHRLIELHGGRISAFSDGLGTGSRFEVRLPRIEGPAPAAGDPADGPVTSPRRILVIDDNVDAADAITELLRMDGHDVRTLHGGADVLPTVHAFRPEVVLLDIGLPGKDGYQIAAELRADPALAGLTLIALTGYGLADDRRRTLEVGFDHHLVKPIDYDELVRLLASEATATGRPVPRSPAGGRLRRA